MPNPDLNVDLLVSGVACIAEILSAADHDARRVAASNWDRFEARLRSAVEDVPLAQLTERFHLNRFELKCVVLALASHVEPRMNQLIAKVGREMFARGVTVRLAIEHFCDTPSERVKARKSFLPAGALIRNRLVSMERSEIGASEGLLSRRLELTTPTLRFLLEEEELSESVANVARLEHPEVSLLNVILDTEQLKHVVELVEHHSRYRELISKWGFDKVLPYGRGICLLFSGPSGTGKTLLATALAAQAKRPVMTLSAADLPEKEGIDATLRDLFTEATMRDAVVLVDECEALFGKGDKRKATAFKAIETFEGILILTTNHPDRLDDALDRRIIYHLPFEVPDANLRRQIWEVHLPPEVPLRGDIDLDVLANTYDFTGGTIKNAILVAVNRALTKNRKEPRLDMELLDEGCRSQLRYALESLTVRETTHLRLRDIVLPDDAMKKVTELVAAIRNQTTVLNRWGFGRKLVTGKGIISLFDGPPGTGKTYCAEIVAGEFDRPLYRVNIPEIVSKWVGETEKNIRAIFQQARVSHAMLLFDEADALFSSRVSETKSSNDRHANMEVNLLLQEIERFPGVCILTTNFYGALDKALLRRIAFRVTFEEPDAEQRAKIWQLLCPPEAPVHKEVDWLTIAKKWELTGGRIKNALLRAAYWACDQDSDLTMEIIEDACLEEYRAAGKVTRDPNWKPPVTNDIADKAAAGKGAKETKAPPAVTRH